MANQKETGLSVEDKKEVNNVAGLMLKGSKLFADCYTRILILLGFDAEQLLADNLSEFRPDKARFKNVMFQWAQDFESKLIAELKETLESATPPQKFTESDRKRCENKVKNSRSDMMAWFRDVENTGFSFIDPTRAPKTEIAEKDMSPAQIKKKAIDKEAKETKDIYKDIMAIFKDVLDERLNNDRARANDNKVDINKSADTTWNSLRKLAEKYQTEMQEQVKQAQDLDKHKQ